MSIRKKLLFAAAAALMPATLVAGLAAGPASATNATPVGPITCSAKVVIKFAPPLTLTGTGTTTVKAKGVLNQCADSNANDGIKKVAGKISGTFSVNGGCGGLAVAPATPTTEVFSVNWKGAPSTKGAPKIVGASTITVIGNDTLSQPVTGNVGFGIPGFTNYPVLALASNVTGFFAGPVTTESNLYSTQNQAAVSALCLGKGLKVLHVAGSVALP